MRSTDSTAGPHRAPRLPVLLALSLAAAPLVRADSEEYSAPAHLESSLIQPGAPLTVTLRCAREGAIAWILYGTSPAGIAFGNPHLPVLRIGAPRFTAVAGTIGTNGKLSITSVLPPSLPIGSTVYMQGIVRPGQGRWFGSEPLTLTIGASPAIFADGTGDLDSVTGDYSASDVDWTDFDKDGALDVVIANADDEGLPLLLRNVDGALVDETFSRLPAAAQIPALCIEAADVDKSGKVDLFIAGTGDVVSPAPNLLLLNDGTGAFTVAASFPAGAGVCIDAEFGDVDGDRDQDLVIANRQDSLHPLETPDGVVLYVNQGGVQGGSEGAFVGDVVFESMPGTNPHVDQGDVSLGDVDNDGDLDLYIARSNQGAGGAQNQLFLNDGTGSFSEVTSTALPAIADNSYEADFGDFDGNGFLDLFVANSIVSQPNGAHLLLNQGPIGPGGTPVFVDASANIPFTFGPATKLRIATEVGDVDEDGDLDVVVGIHELFDAGQPAGRTALLLNRGGSQGGVQGTFEVDTAFDPTGLFICADVALGDIDTDGDLDLYLANTGDLFETDFQDRLLIND